MAAQMNFLVIHFDGCQLKSPVMVPVHFNTCARVTYMFCIDLHSGRIFSLFRRIFGRVCPVPAAWFYV